MVVLKHPNPSVFRKDKNEKWLKFRVASYNIRYAAANDEKIGKWLGYS